MPLILLEILKPSEVILSNYLSSVIKKVRNIMLNIYRDNYRIDGKAVKYLDNFL